jgi:hypothetical protein
VLEALLADLALSGWTISWAFQFAPDHWRVSIIHHSDIGEPQGTYISHCADGPDFASALEDAILRRNDATFTPTDPTIWSIDGPTDSRSLLDLLNLRPTQKSFPRRI